MSLLLIDGHNFLFKSYGVPFKFSSNKGTPLHVITTYLSMVRRSVEAAAAKSIVIVFDAQGQTSNHELSAEYKSNRTYEFSEEDSPFIHLPYIKQCLDLLNIAWIEEPGTEADDIIASLATVNPGKSFIASSDTDFLQLIDDRIKIVKLLSKGRYEILDKVYVNENYGINPDKFVELKCWVGDTADNIKGIAGIGWKRGEKILTGELHRELTIEENETLELNRKLIKLDCDLDIALPPSTTKLILELSNQEIFGRCGF